MTPGDIVRVPLPYVEATRVVARPALVLATVASEGMEPLIRAPMNTSAANGGWADDVSLVDRSIACGLRVPCVIRCAKIATLSMTHADVVGRLPDDPFAAARRTVAAIPTDRPAPAPTASR